MTLDNEDQRALLLQFIDTAPVQGPMGQVLELAEKVSALRSAILAAPVQMEPAQEMLVGR